MSPLSHLNQSAGQSPLSDVERNSSHGGSTGGIPVEGFSGFNVVVSGISVVSFPDPSSGESVGGVPVGGLTVEGPSGVTGPLSKCILVLIL